MKKEEQEARFNPLHCGAVVASRKRSARSKQGVKFQSPSLRGSGRFASAPRPRAPVLLFQSPSLRGSGRFARTAGPGKGAKGVSIPFIAGQWSLLVMKRGLRYNVASSFNPLHCGAVVASKWCLCWRLADERSVSIPFIAGQWSLLGV